jgi:hypothetical protein
MHSYKTVPESFETLKLQVKYLAEGTNPIVFFPSNTNVMPKLPDNMRSLIRKEGVYYYNPTFLSESLITEAVEKGMGWLLLGFAQNKSEAIKSKVPIAITVRDQNAKEIKTAIVDSSIPELAQMQAYIFGQWFPYCRIESTTVFHIIAERLAEIGDLNA